MGYSFTWCWPKSWSVVLPSNKEKQSVEDIKRGLLAWQSMGSALYVPQFLGELAEGLRSIGRHDEALGVVCAAIRKTEESGKRQFAAELNRIEGTVLLAQGKLAESEKCFQRAVEIARNKGAKMWELRATRSHARLMLDTNRRDDADIYGWFTEGFDTRDLKEAKALLDELS